MKNFIAIPAVIFMSTLSAQELHVTMDNGFAIVDMQEAKKIMLQRGVQGGVEIRIKKDYYMAVSAGGSLLQHSYTNSAGEQGFNRKFFLKLMMSGKKYYPFSKKSAGFVETGLYAAYFLRDKKEIRSTGIIRIEKINNLGWNGGFMICMGFKTMITPTISFSVGLLGQKDYTRSYKVERDRIMTQKTSLAISFYRKL